MSIFTTIKYQLVNQADKTNGCLELSTFSTRVIDWLEDQKILLVLDRKPNGFLKPDKVEVGGKYVYHIKYTALNPDHSFFRGSRIHKDSEKDLKDDRYSRGTHSQIGEYDMYSDETKYEKIAFEDMVCSDFIAGDFDMSLQDYLYERENNVAFKEESDSYLKEWLEKNTAPVYTYTDEEACA